MKQVGQYKVNYTFQYFVYEIDFQHKSPLTLLKESETIIGNPKN